MPALTRDLAITYAGTSVGGSTERLIHGPWEFRRSSFGPGRSALGVLTFQLLIGASSNAAFVAERSAVEAAFSTARGALLVTLGGQTHLDLDPADGTAFNATSEIGEVPGSPFNTARSRLYSVRIELELPVDLSGQNGLRECKVSRSYTPSRRATIVLEGVYTQVSTTNARDQYDAQKGTLFSTKKGSADLDDSATYEIVGEEASTNDTNTLCTFRLTYQEVLINQSVSALNDPDLVQPSLRITRSQRSLDSPENTGPVTGEPSLAASLAERGPATPPVELVAVFEAWVDKNNSTNPQALWASKVRSLVLQQIRVHAVSGEFAVVEESPSFDRYENKIAATVRAIVFGSKLISFTIETEDAIDDGLTVTPVWSPNPLDAYVFQRPVVAIRTVTRTSRFTGTTEDRGVKSETLRQGPGWIPVGPRRVSRRRLLVGLGSDSVPCSEVREVFAMRYVNKPGVDVGGGLAGRR